MRYTFDAKQIGGILADTILVDRTGYRIIQQWRIEMDPKQNKIHIELVKDNK